MNHKGKDSHLSGTSVVKLNSTLGGLGLLVEGVPSEVKCTVTEVTREFSLTSDILHYSKLQESNEQKDLQKTSRRNLGKSGDTGGDGVEAGSRVVNVSRKTDTSGGDDVSKYGKHGNTSVLELDVTKTVETLLIGILEHAKRIVESKRSLGTNLRLEGLDGGLGVGNLGRGKGSGRGDKGGGDGGLHFS